MTDQLAFDLAPPKAKRRQRIHENSRSAHQTELPRLNSRALAVLAWFKTRGPATDRQCMRGMGFSDPNAVRPRITELIELGWLQETGKVRDQDTGKQVRVVAFKEKKE